MPQCLNILDKINGNNMHNLIFNEANKERILNIYGEPNLKSLRNVAITFNPSFIFSFLFLIQVKIEGEANYKNISYNVDYKKVTHIKFIKRYNLSVKKPIILEYRLKQNIIINTNYISQLISDVCELSFEITDGTKCEIDFCELCKDTQNCQICENTLNSELFVDENKISENYGKCICDETKGFKKNPNKKYNMCICKDNYSFYKDTTQCISNEELRKIPTYINHKDEISGINVYDDCYRTCSKCSKGGFSYEEQNCDECKEGYILKGNNCIENYV